MACANIIPGIESIFLWNDELNVAQETKVIFKTKSEQFEKVKEMIEEKGKYEIPEILCLPIIEGNKEYLDWINESV